MTELLPPADLRRFGGSIDAQAEKLAELGIPFIRDGKRILVSREHLRQRLLGVQLRQSVGPRLDLVR